MDFISGIFISNQQGRRGCYPYSFWGFVYQIPFLFSIIKLSPSCFSSTI